MLPNVTLFRQAGDILSDGAHYLVVPPGHVWVEGDNSPNSYDSRHYGPVPLAQIHGRVVAKVRIRHRC